MLVLRVRDLTRFAVAVAVALGVAAPAVASAQESSSQGTLPQAVLRRYLRQPRSGTPRPSSAPPSARVAPLRPFTSADLRRFDGMLDQGTVGLVELHHEGGVPAIHLATRVHAPAARVAQLLGHPEGYPDFMPAVDTVSVTERDGSTLAYSWRWTTAIFQLAGESMLTLFSPPRGQEERGYRVAVERTGGDLGEGREVWRVLPRGPNESLVLLSVRVDMRESNYLTRSVSAGSQSLNRSITLALASAMLLRTQAEAERLVGHTRPPRPAPLRRPEVDMLRLEPLLRRGDMLLIESNGAQLVQSSVMTRIPHDENRVRTIMLNPIAFTQALIPGSSAEVREIRDGALDFHWQVDLPLIGTGGDMTLTEHDDRTVELSATGGAMDGGRWRFVTQEMSEGATGIVGWAAFDVGDANFVLRAICDADEAFRPGLSAATEIMMARAMRIRARSQAPLPPIR